MSVEAFARILSCYVLIAVPAVAAPHAREPVAAVTPSPVMTQPKTDLPSSAPRSCIDQMETEPDYDDLEALPVADTVDGGCLTSPEPIST